MSQYVAYEDCDNCCGDGYVYMKTNESEFADLEKFQCKECLDKHQLTDTE